MSVVAPQAPSKAHRRHRALESALERLRTHCEAHARSRGADPSAQLRTAHGTVDVDPWALAKIQSSFERTGDPCSGESELIAHGVALLIKSVEDRVRLEQERRSPTRTRALFATQAELMLDTAIGMALIREMQHAVQAAVQRGQMERARNLSRFQHDLRGAVSGIKSLLADAERQRAETLSDNLTDQPRADETIDHPRREPPPASITDQRRKIRRRARMRKHAREALAHLPSRTEVLFVLLAVLVGLWLGVVKSQRFFEEAPPTMTLADFQNGAGLQAVESHFPSLFITVETATWESFDATRRRQLIDRVSSIISANGYSGALFKTAGGRPVAHWLRERGAQLIEQTETEQSTRTGSDYELSHSQMR